MLNFYSTKCLIFSDRSEKLQESERADQHRGLRRSLCPRHQSGGGQLLLAFALQRPGHPH